MDARTDDPAPPAWHAIFVACTEYPTLRDAKPADVYDRAIRLHGPENDVRLLRDQLERVVVGEWASVTTLAGMPAAKDEQPTLRNVQRALRELSRRDLEGARVLLYFAGHGARQRDEGGDEPDGLDEVFLAADAGVAERGLVPGALSDDALARHVSALRARGASVWVVMDCCHAATGMRGDGPRHRGLPDGLLGVSPGRGSARRDRPDPLGADLDGVVAFYASESTAQTPELDLKGVDGVRRRHGLFTWALAHELERADPGETFHDLFRRVERRYVQKRGAVGTVPIAEGDVSMTLDGRARGAPPVGWLQGDWAEGDDDLARAARLRVDVVGTSAAMDALFDGAAGRIVRWSGAGADVTVDATGERIVLHAGGRSAFVHDPASLGERLGALRLLRIARALGEDETSDAPLVVTLDARAGRSGAYGPTDPATRLAPSTALASRVRWTEDTAVDLHALWIDGSLAAGTFFPRGGATPRLSPRRSGDGRRGAEPAAFGDLALMGRRAKVSDSGLGIEHLVVLGFPAAPGDAVVRLGELDLGTTMRSDGGRSVRPWAVVRSISTGWSPLAPLTWPDRADDEALVAGVTRAVRNDVVLVRRSGAGAPHEARVDFDGPGVDAGDPGFADGPRFDLVLRITGAGAVAMYDTDGDGTPDLELLDPDRDGAADSFRERANGGWGATRTVRLPLLDLGHFGVRAAAFDRSRVRAVLSSLCD